MPNWMQNIGDRMREAVMAKRGGFNPGPAQEGMGDKPEMMRGGGFVDPRGGINPGGDGIGMMEPKGGGFISPIVNAPPPPPSQGMGMARPNANPFSAAPAPAMAQPRPNMGMAPRPMAAPARPMGGGRPPQNPGAMRMKRRMGMF